MPAPKKPVSTFSIDDFLGEIEKAEDMAASKPLPQERLRNKRALDRAAAAEASAAEPLTPLQKRRTTKTNYDTATGMAPKAPKSKANAVERPTNVPGMGESDQAGFGHLASRATRDAALTARDISREAAKNPEVMADLRTALDKAKRNTRKKGGPGTAPANAETVGVTATVQALEKIILHGRPEVEGAPPWVPHRPARPSKPEGGRPFRLATDYTPAGDQPTAIAELVEGINNGETDQVLLGVTGSGKTFTAAQVIAQT